VIVRRIAAMADADEATIAGARQRRGFAKQDGRTLLTKGIAPWTCASLNRIHYFATRAEILYILLDGFVRLNGGV